jgi:gamma-glutamyltranspeptidase/glutathione hydrolase
LLNGLRSLGHTVSSAAQSSGVATIVKKPKQGYLGLVLEGGADPRREGIALGDTFD